MTGATSLRCSECGREVKSERRLYRTRRHWRVALLGVLLLLAGLGTYYGGEVHRDGWVRATPTVAYIAALPWLDQNTTLRELNNRINSGELREWEYRFLVHRCIGILKSSDDPQMILRPVQLISAVDSAYRYKRSNQPWGNWYSVFVGRGDDVMDELIALLNHPDAGVRSAVLDCFRRLSFGSSRILPAVLARFLDEDPKIRKSARSLLQFIGADLNGVRFQAGMAALTPLRKLELDQDSDPWRAFEALCNELADCGPDFERAISVLKAGMHSQHAVLQGLSIYALTGCQSEDPQVRDEVLRRFDSADHSVQLIALAATPAFPLDDRVRRVIRWGLQQADTESMALQVIAARGREAEEYCPDLQQRFASLSDGIFDAAVSAYCQIGGDPEVAVNACLDRFQHSVADRAYGSRPAGEIDLIARVGAGSPKVINVLESCFQNPDKGVRCAAACAYAVLGGEDLDTATRIILDAIAASTAPGDVNRIRAKYFARRGRISVPVMIEELSAVEPARRANATQLLAEAWHAGIPALSKLREMRNDPDPQVRTSIGEAIERIEWTRDHPDWRPSR